MKKFVIVNGLLVINNSIINIRDRVFCGVKLDKEDDDFYVTLTMTGQQDIYNDHFECSNVEQVDLAIRLTEAIVNGGNTHDHITTLKQALEYVMS